jgi:hypothetical protein
MGKKGRRRTRFSFEANRDPTVQSRVFYPHLNELCRKFLLIGDQTLTSAEVAAYEPTRKKVESEIFENLAVFDRIDFKVHGENVPLAVLLRLFGVNGFQRLMEQGAIRFTLWTPMVGHLVDDIEGIDPLVCGRHSSLVHCDPEESIAMGLKVLDPALKPGEHRMISRKVRDLYSLPDDQLAEEAVKLTKSAFLSGKLQAYGLDPEHKEYQRLGIEDRKELTNCATELAEYMHLVSNDMTSLSSDKYFDFFAQSQKRLAHAEAQVESLSLLLRLDHFPDLAGAYHQAKDPFPTMIKLREQRSAKKFRQWLRTVSASTRSVEEVTSEYLDAIQEPKGFFQTKFGKLTKVISMTSIGAGIGHALGGMEGMVGGAALAKAIEPAIDPGLDLVDEFLLDGLLKGWTPRMFIEDMADKQLLRKLA